MKFLVVFVLVALAMGNAEECSEERAEACVETLLSSILGDTSEEEVCKELRTSIGCLRNAVDECIAEEEKDDELEEGLQELEKVLKENCKSEESGDTEEDSEMQKCFEENEEYIYECIYQGTTEALSIVIENDIPMNENTLQCAMYGAMSSCFMERVGEKCGQEAAQAVEEEMDDMPQEIVDACEAAGGVDAHSFQLLDKKKK